MKLQRNNDKLSYYINKISAMLWLIHSDKRNRTPQPLFKIMESKLENKNRNTYGFLNAKLFSIVSNSSFDSLFNLR